jgi:hypothetical protein
MHKYDKQILIGARVPVSVKEKLSKYCLDHGTKMNYFIAQAIKEKLEEIKEDNRDVAIAEGRLKNPEFISQADFNKYLSRRKIKS